MRLRVVAMHVVEVVGRAQAKPELLAEAGQRLVHRLLAVDAVALHLEQKTILAKDVAIGGHRFARAIEVSVGDPAGRLTLQAARKSDETVRVLGQDLLVDAGLVVHPLHLPNGAELHQVEVAVVVSGQEGQVVGIAVDPSLAQQPRARGDVDLAADDRLDPRVLARLVEVDRAVHHAVVGHGERGHLELGRTCHERGDAARPIEQRILGVVMEVDKGVGGVRHSLGWVGGTPG